MEALSSLADGFVALMTVQNLLFALAGVLLGTFVGALPGLGPSAGIAILLPLVFVVPPTGGLIMLGAIYYGNMYGNTISSVLLNMPGDAASVATTFDGYQMAVQGRGGAALGIAAIGSFVAGTLSVVLLTFLAPTIANLAIKLGPAENFCLIMIGLLAVASLTGKAPAKGYIMAAFGILVSMIGLDAVSYQTRLTFGFTSLLSGIDFTPVILGFFGLAEIFANLDKPPSTDVLTKKTFWLSDVWPTRDDVRKTWKSILRGTAIGFPVGVLPGTGASVATFLAYAAERRASKTPERFGTGAIEGVAAPEAANNAAATGAFIPMLALGIPGSSTTAILLAAMIMWGLQPGPLLFQQHPEIVWPFIASQYVGNIMLLVVNIMLVPVFVWLLRISTKYLNGFVAALAVVGAYSINYDMFDVWLMLGFGVLGFALRKFDYPAAPLILAFVLGPMAEEFLRQALSISGGSLAIFVERPISLTLVALIVVVVFALPLFRMWRERHRIGDDGE